MEKATFRTLCLGLLLLSTTSFAQNGNNINGKVRYQDNDNYPLSGVIASLHNSNGEIILKDTTKNGGHYEFHNIPNGTYEITFTTNQPAGGVTLSDAYAVLQNIQGQLTFNNIQKLAADVDGDGSVTMNDYDLILNGYLNEGEPFPIGPWVFEKQNLTLPSADREGFTNRGTSSGDANGSLVPDPKTNSIFLENPTISLNARPSDPIDFKISGGQNIRIGGMHLVIDIPEGLSVSDVKSLIPGAKTSMLNNQIRITWIDIPKHGIEIMNDSPLLVVSTKVTSPSQNGSTYSLHLNKESHFIDNEGNMVSGVALTLPTININTIEDFKVEVFPNPFRENTNFNCQLPSNGIVIISLYDQAGRKVSEISDSNSSAGIYQVKIDGSGLMPGVYHYTVVYSGSNQLVNSGTIIKSK